VQYEDRVTIATPEGVDLEMTLAGVGSRLAAALIDDIIKFAVIFAIFFGLGIADGISNSSLDPQQSDDVELVLIAFGIVISFLLYFGYDIAFEVLASGRTLGKRALGLRVVRVGGQPVAFTTSAVRNLLRIVDFLPISYAAGITSVLISRRNQRLGDLVAGTLVVRERKGITGAPRPPAPIPRRQEVHQPGASTQAPPVPAGSWYGWDLTAVTIEDLSTVRSFLQRRHQLTADARGRLAWELSQRLRTKVAGAPDNVDAEAFLEQIVAAKSARS
jgi:uncharacterized RDD family membrane protein YckC